MAHLKPMLEKIKEDTPAVPREHELWSPIFPPFLTKEQQERFLHLKAERDERTGEWVEVERRWMMVTVCRQVAGEFSFREWSLEWREGLDKNPPGSADTCCGSR